jgi:hypothetical protein
MGVPIKVGSVHINPLGGLVQIKGVVVGNPEGFKTPSAIELDHLRVEIDVASLLSSTILVKEILIEGPRISYEVTPNGTNIGAIQKNVEKATAGDGKEAPPATTETPKESAKTDEEQPGKKVVIGLFSMKDGQVRASVSGPIQAGSTLPLPTIELRDIGKDKGGTSLGAALKEIFGAFTKALGGAVGNLTQGAADVAKQLTGVISGGLGSAAQGVGQAGEQAKESAGAAAEQVQQQAQQAQEAAKDMVKKTGEQAKEALKGLGGLLGGK